MSKGRSPRSDVERSKIQTTAHENKQLKRELGRLRKLLDRAESFMCSSCSEHREEDQLDPPYEAPSPNRACHKCSEGQLKIIKYRKVGEDHYYRKCDSCVHRTIGKKYTPDVKD